MATSTVRGYPAVMRIARSFLVVSVFAGTAAHAQGFDCAPPAQANLGFEVIPFDGTADGLRKYFVDGRSYEENQFGDWYLYEAGNAAAPDYSNRLDLRSGTLAGVLTAELVGLEDFAGIAANHFVFDETDLAWRMNEYDEYAVEEAVRQSFGF